MMPIQNYSSFTRMTTFCRTRVPDSVKAALESIKDDDEAVKTYGVNLCVNMCHQLLHHGMSSRSLAIAVINSYLGCEYECCDTLRLFLCSLVNRFDSYEIQSRCAWIPFLHAESREERYARVTRVRN